MSGYKKGRAWIELDMAALGHNYKSLCALLPQGCRLMPAVKANAYGHGAELIAPELESLGAACFCVASALEGAQLRRVGIRGDILVLGYTHPEDMPLLYENGLIQTVLDADYAKALSDCGLSLRCHLAIDSGMHRLGFDYRDVEAMAAVFSMENLRPEGAFSHLCTQDRDFSGLQARRFYGCLERLQARGCNIPCRHLLSSYSLIDSPYLGGSLARVGIAMYGLLSCGEDEKLRQTELRPVLSLKSRVSSLRSMQAGEGAGYGLCFRAETQRRIAAVSIGYADGLPSTACQGGRVLINGHFAPIVGRICMDQTLIDVTQLPQVSQGDEVVFIGRSGDKDISAYELSQCCGCITNELLSRLGQRLERIPAKP